MMRREFLYEVTFWEVQRIILGFRKRDRMTHQLLAEVFYAALYANPYRKHDGKNVTDMFPQLFDDHTENLPITKEDVVELQELMARMNQQSETQT